MQISYSMNMEDYVQYYLYNASKNVQLSKRRSRTRLFTFLVCLPISFMYFYKDMLLMGGGFLLMGLLWYILLPRFDGKMHKKSFERYVQQNHQDDFKDELNIEISKNKCTLKSRAGESVFMLNEISSLEETGSYLFVFMNNGQSLGIPKRSISELEQLVEAFLGASPEEGKYLKQLDWVWK